MRDLTLPRRALLCAAALLAAPAIIRPARAAGQCIVGTWGGDYARLLRENIDDPIIKPAGVEVVQDVGDESPACPSCTRRRSCRAAAWTSPVVGAVNGYRVNEAELVEELTEKKVPNLKHVRGRAAMPGFVHTSIARRCWCTARTTCTDPPHTLGDLLDPKWKGKIGMVSTVAPWVLMAASLYKTGKTTDFDKAKAFMLKLNANGLRLYPETDALAPAFKSGEISVGVIWLARTFMWQNAGFPVKGEFPQEGAILYVSGMVMPKNAPNREAAWQYMNAMLDPRAQQGFAAHMGYCRRSTTRRCPARWASNWRCPIRSRSWSPQTIRCSRRRCRT